MPAPKRLDPTRSVANLLGWLVRQHRGDLPQERLARRLAEALGRPHLSGSLVGKIETAEEPLTAELAVALDQVFGTRGLFTYLQIQAARERQGGRYHEAGPASPTAPDDQGVSAVPSRRAFLHQLGTGAQIAAADRLIALLGPGIGEALEASRQAGTSSLAPGTLTQLEQVIDRQAAAFPTSPPAAVEPELRLLREWVGGLLGGKLTLGEHRALVVAAGYLSALRALVRFDLGDHAAALAWCDDAEQHGREAGDPELAAWSYETRVLVAFYGGRPGEAVEQARRGIGIAPRGSVARAKLSMHEMRGIALTGDRQAFQAARRRMDAAVQALPNTTQPAPGGKVFTVNPAADPHLLTGTSLVKLGRWGEAERLIREHLGQYSPGRHTPGQAIGLVDLGLALAGLGRPDEAASHGMRALEGARLVGSVVARAGELDATLTRRYPQVAETPDFHERYLTAVGSLAGSL